MNLVNKGKIVFIMYDYWLFPKLFGKFMLVSKGIFIFLLCFCFFLYSCSFRDCVNHRLKIYKSGLNNVILSRKNNNNKKIIIIKGESPL
jgi:hypothetical protein